MLRMYNSIILNMHGLGRRHTAQTFGRDSAIISAISHTDWLSVACPVGSHQSKAMKGLRADGIQPGSLEWVILLQWLGSEKETSCFAFSCLYQPSLFITGFAPCSLALRCLYLLVNLNLESHSLRRKAAHFGGLT